MSDHNITAEVGPVNNWEVGQRHGQILTLYGLNEDDEVVVERNYTLDVDATRIKDDDGEWVEVNVMDDGGFPPDAMFTAYSEE